ncbi:GNAT family N-acetyltransferase [Terracoccus sp. 273MFTsu3.1]|uniref:GNAT family N-acetyltransferase n=1 Tax=Terracoccus sp. 273MFTsu3.1 TaxID=1172188 RepID=UPI00036CCE5A|nr:GNAT family N-acetyltransferase [Terracoccus sp. 273MFTsu3.1]
MSRPRATGWVVERGDVTSEESATILRDYLVDVSDRWFRLREGRDSTPEEIEQSLAEMPSDDLAPPTGAFVVARSGARSGARLVGCAGVRLVPDRPDVVELKRMFVRPEARGSGIAAALLAAAEEAARDLGATTVRLDTRLDLVEARALYRRQGYVEVPAFNEGDYAEVWYAKTLR